jgi:hypothetical protein
VVLQPVQQRIDERLVIEQAVPRRVLEVRCNDGAHAPVALIHQAEECIDLFGLEVQVSELVDFR